MGQSDRVVDQSGTKEDTGRAVDLKLETLVGIVKESATGPANVEHPKRSTPVKPLVIGGSVSIVTDGRNGIDMYVALGLNEN